MLKILQFYNSISFIQYYLLPTFYLTDKSTQGVRIPFEIGISSVVSDFFYFAAFFIKEHV